jgi:FAD/FMN-containing dehydrogenase
MPTFPRRSEWLRNSKGISDSQTPCPSTKDLFKQYRHPDLSTSNSSGRAAAVVHHRSADGVAIIADACHASRVPMIPYGAGFSVEGNFS